MPDDQLSAELAKIRDRAGMVNYAIATENPRQFTITLTSQGDVAKLLAAVEQVIEEHGPVPAILDPDSDLRYCAFDGFVYPCPTVSIVREALLGKDGTDG